MKKRKYIGTRVRKVTQPITVQQPSKNRQHEHDLTLQQALTLFIRAKEAENVRPRTIRNYMNHITYLSDYMTEVRGFRNAYLKDLTADLIRDYISYMLNEKRRYEGLEGRKDKTVGLAVDTINIRLRTLRTMCRFWHAEGLIEENPMANIKQLRKDADDEVPGLTDAEIDLLLSSYDVSQFAEWRDKILILLMLDTGLRPGEACELTIDRVDFDLYTLYVPSQIAKNRRNREVPMSREVAKLLEELYEESLQYFGETEFIFNNAYGEPYTADAFRKRLNRRKKKLGMEKLSPNMFRHTFCRKYLLNGGDIFTLQKIVDHKDIATTRKYVQMGMDDVQAQHNKYSPAKRILKRKR